MDIEILGILLGAVLPIYPVLFAIYQKIGNMMRSSRSSRNSGRSTKITRRTIMEPEVVTQEIRHAGRYRDRPVPGKVRRA